MGMKMQLLDVGYLMIKMGFSMNMMDKHYIQLEDLLHNNLLEQQYRHISQIKFLVQIPDFLINYQLVI